MNIVVYKGFDIEFLKEVKDKPLVENHIEEKFILSNLNDEYENEIEVAFLQKRKSNDVFWITYEELTLSYDYFINKFKSNNVEIKIVDNNIYPNCYPMNVKFDDETYTEFLKVITVSGAKSSNSEVAILEKLYSSIYKINDVFFASYFNYESEHDGWINIEEDYYLVGAKEAVGEECEFLVKIGDNVEDYLKYITSIDFKKIKKIAYTLFCETDVSNMILKSLKALLGYNQIDYLYKFSGDYISNDKLFDEFKEIAENVLKYSDFKFKSLDFYKNPGISNEMEELSQGTIMSYIVNEAEKAHNGDVYRDIFITAPTGAGKSLIFQIPAIYLANKYNKLIIIIEPLKGLMADQQEKYEKCGYKKARFLNSDIPTPMEREQIIDGVKNGEIDILYISPETLLSHSLDSLVGDREIGLIVVDEAHIVTTWGVGFRPDYWYLGSYLNDIRKSYNYKGKVKSSRNFPIFACTATAVYGGKDDTVSETILSLYMNDPIVKIGTAKRKNLSFDITVHDKDSFDKYEEQKNKVLAKRIEEWIKENEKTVVYYPYKSLAHEAYNSKGKFVDYCKYKYFSRSIYWRLC